MPSIAVHKRFGEGRVISSRSKGYELYVEFGDGIARWIKKHEITIRDEYLQEGKGHSKDKPSLNNTFDSRRLIEALRFGIAPYDYCDRFTFGREKEIKEIEDWLNNDSAGAIIIQGEYGTGKSHIIDYIYNLAKNNDWAVSRLETNPLDSPFHKPRQVYQSIIHSLSYIVDDKVFGFRDLIKDVLKNHKAKNTFFNDYVNYLGERLKGIEAGYEKDIDELIQFHIEDYPFDDYSTTANLCCNVINGIGWIARNILNMKGFLILFDEAELINSGTYYQNVKGENLLKGLILMANNDKRLLDEQLKYDNGYFGEFTGLQHYGHARGIRYLWKKPSCVKLGFAFAPSMLTYNSYLRAIPNIDLEPIQQHYFKNAGSYIHNIYEIAYDFRGHLKWDELPMDSTRKFVKAVVERLDISRHKNQRPIKSLKDTSILEKDNEVIILQGSFKNYEGTIERYNELNDTVDIIVKTFNTHKRLTLPSKHVYKVKADEE